jgi:hypothetical protein
VAGCCSSTGSGCTGLFFAGPWRPALPARGKRGDGAGGGRRHKRPWPRATPTRWPRRAWGQAGPQGCGLARAQWPDEEGAPIGSGPRAWLSRAPPGADGTAPRVVAARGGCRVSPGYGPRIAGERVSGGRAHHREGPLASGGGGAQGCATGPPVRLERWPSDRPPLNGMARFWRVWRRRAVPHRLGARRGA